MISRLASPSAQPEELQVHPSATVSSCHHWEVTVYLLMHSVTTRRKRDQEARVRFPCPGTHFLALLRLEKKKSAGNRKNPLETRTQEHPAIRSDGPLEKSTLPQRCYCTVTDQHAHVGSKKEEEMECHTGWKVTEVRRRALWCRSSAALSGKGQRINARGFPKSDFWTL